VLSPPEADVSVINPFWFRLVRVRKEGQKIVVFYLTVEEVVK